MNLLKRTLAMLLVVCMMAGAISITAFATEPQSIDPLAVDPADNAADLAGDPLADVCPIDCFDSELSELSQTDDYRILHLDCGRKYFTKDWIIALINEMAAAGYTQLQLAFGNDGMRFLLDDMAVTANGTTYSSESVKAGIQTGNRNYYDFGTNELTEDEMDAILAHADAMGIEVVPHVNMPGHMDAIVDAIEYVGISDAHYTGWYTSTTSLNLNNDKAVAFAKALLQKYVDYFADNGCKYFHIGADEYANDAYGNSMGFPNIGSNLYTEFANYVNDCAAIVESRGMTPRAWNDGISYGYYSNSFDTDIQVTYWSSGWLSYNVASAQKLDKNGHDMINTHGDYYYILGKGDKWGGTNHDPNLYTEAGNWSNDVFCDGNTIDSAGSMFCIWCDYPNYETETQIAANTRLVLRAMAAEMQELDAASISTDVVSGGFNADGTINNGTPVIPEPKPDPVTKEDQEYHIAVTAPELTAVVATPMEDLPEIIDSARVVAWDIVPMIGETEYHGSATVALPVPDGWNPDLVKGFYMENGEAILVTGTYADGFYSFEMPHFSTGGLMERDINAPDETIYLEVGGTHEIVIKNETYNGEILTDPTGIASVTAVHEETEGTGSVTPVTDPTVGKAYYIINNGKYASATASWVDSIDDAVAWTAQDGGKEYITFSYDGKCLGYDPDYSYWLTTADATDYRIEYFKNWYGTWEGSNSEQAVTFAEASGSVAVNQSTITFTGIAPGTTYCKIGETTYRIVVRGSVEITVNYKLADGTLIKSETVTVYDDATSIDISNFNHTDGKFYVVENANLTINPKDTAEYDVIVTEADVDLEDVTPLTIEYWITNSPATTEANGNITELGVRADVTGVYSEAGVDVTQLLPETTYRAEDLLIYWHSRLLQGEANHQIQQNGVDKTRAGLAFTKIRYWQGESNLSWQVLSNDTWQEVNLEDDQLVAYYMQITEVTDEVTTLVVDWGPQYSDRGNMSDWFWGSYVSYGRYIFVDYAVVYEDGTITPAAFPNDNTIFFTCDGSSRSINGMLFTETADYEIWKVTATDGTSSRNNNNNSIAINYNLDATDAEETLWEINDGGEPYITGLENISATEGKLIRIYVRAVETEDTLKVVYYDEKFGDTLVEYNVNVPNGSNFNNGIVVANTKTPATLPAFSGNADRKDATGYGIVNALDKTQNFRTALTLVPEAVGKYNNGLYTYTGSVVSADGSTITHYYTINAETLSPNFVADFGLPLSFPLNQVVGKGQEVLVESVTVNENTRYGTLTYVDNTSDGVHNGTFTYTPTEVLQNIDVLSINIKLSTHTTTDLINVGVTPATTVYYGEQFLNFSNGWTSVGTFADVGQQAVEVLGESSYYGYDDAYAACTGASDGTASKSQTIGDTATFTFTGTGIQVFANSTTDCGYVSVLVKNKDTGAIANVSMVDTSVGGTANTDTSAGQIGKSLYGLPVVSLVEVTGLQHATYEVTITKIMDTDPVFIDGIRVFGTVNEANYTADENPFTADEEDNPDFYEVRDLVMKAMGIAASDSVDYKTVFNAIYTQTVEVGDSAVVTSVTAPYGTANRQDLLDKGPKNELYLFQGDTLTLNVKTDRVVQLGLKAPEGTASYTLNGDDVQTLSSTVDMFYEVAGKGEATNGMAITITNTGSNILSVTLLKICDDPNVTFPALTEDNIKNILANAGYVDTPAALSITAQPQSYEGLVGDMVDFSVEAEGEDLSYQWFYSSDDGANWWKSTASGATTATLSVELRAYRNGQMYKCVVTDANGETVESDPAAMTLCAGDFSIVSQPTDFTGAEGDTATFTVEAKGDNLTYRWQYSTDEGETWLNSWSVGYATNTLQVDLRAYRNGQMYRCLVSNANGDQIASDAAALIIRSADITINTQPQSVTMAAGQTVTFTVNAEGDNLIYRWYRSNDGGNTWVQTWLDGYNTNTLSFMVNAARAATPYKCVITSGTTTVETDAVTVTIG